MLVKEIKKAFLSTMDQVQSSRLETVGVAAFESHQSKDGLLHRSNAVSGALFM